MDPEILLHHFGYLAVFAGTFLEGETILVLAGFLASRGDLAVFPTLGIAAFGAWIGHVFWFWLGRRHGSRLMHRFPRFERRIGRSLGLIERYGVSAIFLTQYLYGLRIASAVVFGLSRIRRRTFLIVQAVSCVVWACLIGLLGYFFGRAVERMLGKAEEVETWAVLFILLAGAAVYVFHRLREAAAARKALIPPRDRAGTSPRRSADTFP
jgi:membrane protein DedA with SNARE-associated domain